LISFFSISCASIHSSAKKGNVDGVRSFVEKGVGIDSKDSSGATPLMYAVWGNNFETVKYLVEQKADVNAKDKNGYTPLMYLKYPMLYIYAARDQKGFGDASGSYYPVEDHTGYDCIDKDCRNKTITKYFSDEDNDKEKLLKVVEKLPEQIDSIVKILNFLIEKGADVNSEAKDSDTILNYAVSFEIEEAVEILINKNANVDKMFENLEKKTTNQPRFPCDLGSMLQKHVKSAKKSFCKRNFSCTSLIPYCIDSVDINAENYFKTMLMNAVENGNIDLISMVLERKPDLNYENEYGWTALSLAIENNKKESVIKLLEAGANINFVNKNGITPIITALKTKKPNGDIISLLITKGADMKFKVTNKSSKYNGMTVAEIAKKKGITITIN